MTTGKTLLLIDGHALAFREYYALERSNMRTSNGTPTWAVFGFFKAIFDLLKKEKLAIDAVAVAFDVSHETFRTENYAEYKANREKMPDDMSCQMNVIYEGLEAFSIPIYMKQGFEADDVIGTISKKATELGHKTLILTGDQDAFQLIDKEGSVTVIVPSKGELTEYNWNKVYEKWKVYPDQVIDYKALRGDTSDNIPGVKGIGEKTAQALLEQYYTLDEIYQKIDEYKAGSIKDKLVAGKEMAYKSRFLATIVRDVDIDFDFNNACVALPNLAKVKEFLTKYQLMTFLKNIENIMNNFNRSNEECESKDIQSGDQLGLFAMQSDNDKDKVWFKDKINVTFLDTDEQIDNFCKLVNEHKGFLFVNVPFSVDLLAKRIEYIVFGTKNFTKNGLRYKFDEQQNDIFGEIFILDIKKENIPDKIKKLFENKELVKFTYDLKNQYNLLSAYDCELRNVVFDALLADYVENSSTKHELDVQVLQYLKISPVDKPEFTFSIDEYDDMAREMWILMRLTKYHYENISDNNLKILSDIELPLSKVLSYMELTGVTVDTEYLNEMKIFMNGKINTLEKKIFDEAGEGFNINSTQQLANILFEKLNLPHKKNRKSKYSTDVKVLEELAPNYDIAKYLLEYRKYFKLRSTYILALLKLINPVDNRIHTTYNQALTVTGRLSSSNPNLQNIPARTEDGEKIRAAFVPENRNHKIISADYSQIELRILAHITQDKNLIEAFKNDIDVHALTASKVYGVTIEEVTKQMRDRAKTVNFGIIYGQTGYGLAKALGITNNEAFEFIDKYFFTYPDVKKYMNEIIQKVALDGFTETIWKRRRYFRDEINSSNAMVREFAKRAAINFPMQGSAADLMKLAMIKFYNSLKENNLKSKLIIQVHDEMVVEAYNDEIDLVVKLLKEAMEFENLLSVPLKVDISMGDTWKFA